MNGGGSGDVRVVESYCTQVKIKLHIGAIVFYKNYNSNKPQPAPVS